MHGKEHTSTGKITSPILVDQHLLVTFCTQEWVPGIRDRETKVAEIVVRELQKVKPGKWGYVQTREL